jgi:hypothetical protein
MQTIPIVPGYPCFRNFIADMLYLPSRRCAPNGSTFDCSLQRPLLASVCGATGLPQG